MTMNLDVSRETLDKLRVYEDLLRRWNSKINLVSTKSLDCLWERHFIDSMQIYSLSNGSETWVDLGSGGGFPGLVCAIMSSGRNDAQQFTLIESDLRKSIFLKTVIRETDIKCTVLTKRIETAAMQNAKTVSARALADLDCLIGYAFRHMAPDGLSIFPKGRNWAQEVENARKRWSFDLETINSQTDHDAVILRIKGISRV